jgi:hypothetical protein
MEVVRAQNTREQMAVRLCRNIAFRTVIKSSNLTNEALVDKTIAFGTWYMAVHVALSSCSPNLADYTDRRRQKMNTLHE